MSTELHVGLTPVYTNIWKARDVEEFKKIFLDCLKCHHRAYATGNTLHCDINETNLMIYRPTKMILPPGHATADPASLPSQSIAHATGTTLSHGVLTDFDGTSAHENNEVIEAVYLNHRHRSGIRTFVARELLNEHRPPLTHLYRYDLESFFYVLVCAAVHYELSTGRRRSTVPELAKWNGPDAFLFKASFFSVPLETLQEKYCLPEFIELWDTWITPLWTMFSVGYSDVTRIPKSERGKYDYTTCGGHITFENFMAAIGETLRGPEQADVPPPQTQTPTLSL